MTIRVLALYFFERLPMPSNPLFDLTGTAALVTGGNGGIGRGIALGLAGAGAEVMVAARDEAKNAAVVAELRVLGVHAESVTCDVLDLASIEVTMAATVQAFGCLDILVNNAGVVGGGHPETITDEVWDRIVDTNLRAMFQCCRAAHPHLKAGGEGKVSTSAPCTRSLAATAPSRTPRAMAASSN